VNLSELRSRGRPCPLCNRRGRGKRERVKGLGYVHSACLKALEAGKAPPRGTAGSCPACGGRKVLGPDNPVGPWGENGEEPCPACSGGRSARPRRPSSHTGMRGMPKSGRVVVVTPEDLEG